MAGPAGARDGGDQPFGQQPHLTPSPGRPPEGRHHVLRRDDDDRDFDDDDNGDDDAQQCPEVSAAGRVRGEEAEQVVVQAGVPAARPAVHPEADTVQGGGGETAQAPGRPVLPQPQRRPLPPAQRPPGPPPVVQHRPPGRDGRRGGGPQQPVPGQRIPSLRHHQRGRWRRRRRGRGFDPRTHEQRAGGVGQAVWHLPAGGQVRPGQADAARGGPALRPTPARGLRDRDAALQAQLGRVLGRQRVSAFLRQGAARPEERPEGVVEGPRLLVGVAAVVGSPARGLPRLGGGGLFVVEVAERGHGAQRRRRRLQQAQVQQGQEPRALHRGQVEGANAQSRSASSGVGGCSSCSSSGGGRRRRCLPRGRDGGGGEVVVNEPHLLLQRQLRLLVPGLPRPAPPPPPQPPPPPSPLGPHQQVQPQHPRPRPPPPVARAVPSGRAPRHHGHGARGHQRVQDQVARARHAQGARLHLHRGPAGVPLLPVEPGRPAGPTHHPRHRGRAEPAGEAGGAGRCRQQRHHRLQLRRHRRGPEQRHEQ